MVALEIIASGLTGDSNGGLIAKDWDRSGGYTIYTPKENSQTAAYQAPNPKISQNYLILSNHLRKKLLKIAAEVYPVPNADPATKVRQTRDWLVNNFTYELKNHEYIKGEDPIISFLTRYKKGHCEFFATAAALLLRTQGIPTRYVTGVVCMEPGESKDMWIARMFNFHAWCEAWIPGQGWRWVEATPANGIPNQATPRKNAWLFALSTIWSRFYANIKRGYFAEAVIDFFLSCWYTITWLFWYGPWFIGWGLGIIIILILFIRYFLKRFRQMAEPPTLRALRDLRISLDTCLKKCGIIRNFSMSMREAAYLIASDQQGREDLITLIHDYESLRYNPNVSEGAIENYRQRLGNWQA